MYIYGRNDVKIVLIYKILKNNKIYVIIIAMIQRK